MKSLRISSLVLVSTVLLLGGCGERPAQPATGAAPPPASSNSAVSPATGPQFEAANDAATLTGLEARGTCSLENVVDLGTQAPSPGSEPNTYKVGRTATYRLIGFSTDSAAGVVPGDVLLFLHGAGQSYSIKASEGLERPDVASFFKKPALANSGYQADAGFSNVQPGAYEVFAVNAFGDTRVLCPTHQTLVVE